MHEDLPPLGSTVGPWLILKRLDSGSYGVVFRARRADAPESPPVALKLAKQPGDPRFTREAETLQRSHHPSIPYDAKCRRGIRPYTQQGNPGRYGQC